MKTQKFFLTTTLILLLCFTFVFGNNNKPSMEKYTAEIYSIEIPEFDKLDIKTSDVVVNSSTKAYNDACQQLLRQLSATESIQAKTYIIYLLGSLRYQASAVSLVKIIDFKASNCDLLTRYPRWTLYPAKSALRNIGSPAIKPIVVAIGKEENSLRLQLMLETLCDILTPEYSVCILEYSASKAQGPEKEKYNKAALMCKERCE